MKLFECQHCQQLLYFENTQCVSCGHRLGYLPSKETVSAVEPEGDVWRALAEPASRYKFCANTVHDTCNWLIDAKTPEGYCAACRHNRTIPDLSVQNNLTHWRRMELAKHRLFYSLLKLHLPLVSKAEDPNGLAFDFLESGAVSPHTGAAPVMTGHEHGLITINLAEADDAEREKLRSQMGEPYRTLLGHFRHEIAHYYWDRLIANTPHVDEFRATFGDERRDYGEALQQHYANGPPADWPQNFVSSYASSHPWEDFAETWAHYLHMVDTLETARAFGISVKPRVSKGTDLSASFDFDPHNIGMDRIVDAWLPLTFAMNSINRSMGLSDLYPFVLSPPVILKLAYIHELIYAYAKRPSSRTGLQAIIASLKRNIGVHNSVP